VEQRYAILLCRRCGHALALQQLPLLPLLTHASCTM
jgi:hypothetical protein